MISSDIAIKVENLCKLYRIGLKEELHSSLKDSIVSWVKTPLTNFRRLKKQTNIDGSDDSDDIVRVLNDVSFEVRRGEILGIIGKNGAGKSTLLKILSRITPPTKGRVTINGRIASLLEVGTGFHPELTGRENIYLNGTILGMRKDEVDRKFDEIVDFSGVEKFIDTPIKRYSSGMKVRLAFSVAAHLDPEILLIDEVLAVGDAEFQKKCLGKMQDIAGQDRTIIFVSHNMNAIQNLCNRTLLIDMGQINCDGYTGDVIEKYLEKESQSSSRIKICREGENVFKEVFFRDRKDKETTIFSMGDPINIFFKIDLSNVIREPMVYVRFNSQPGNAVIITGSYDVEPGFTLKEGEHCISAKIDQMLCPGNYSIDIIFARDQRHILSELHDITCLTIKPKNVWKSGWLPPQNRRAWIAKSNWMFDDELL